MRGLDTLDNFIRLRAATRYAVRCNNAVVKLRRWAKSHWWIPLYRNDYGECTITLPGEVDGHRVRVGCDVVAIEDVQDSLAAFGDRYLRKVLTASEINDCQGHNRVYRLAARFGPRKR